MANIFTEFIIMALEQKLDEMQETFVAGVEQHWEQTQENLNPGQQSIFADFLEFVITEWYDYTRLVWPFLDAAEYGDQLMQAYDATVMGRAFSASIWGPVPKMQEKIDRAIAVQETIWVLQASIL